MVGAGWNNLLAGRAEQGGQHDYPAACPAGVPDNRQDLSSQAAGNRRRDPAGARFTKDEILELYLNKAYFGDGLYGVEAASLGYVGKHAEELDVAEAALIAGLVKSPSAYARRPPVRSGRWPVAIWCFA